MKTLSRIKPMHAELIPPLGAVPYGVTPEGKQLYRMVRKRSRAVPRMEIVPGPDGVPIKRQVWRKNQMTGEPLYPVNQPEAYDEEVIFFLESQGNGNVDIRRWSAPSKEEVERAKKAQAVAEMKEKLAEALVDAAIGPNDLLAMLRGDRKLEITDQPSEPVAEDEDEEEEESPYPVMVSPGRWQLSSGAIVKGKREDAERMEEELQDAAVMARVNASLTPEE